MAGRTERSPLDRRLAVDGLLVVAEAPLEILPCAASGSCAGEPPHPWRRTGRPHQQRNAAAVWRTAADASGANTLRGGRGRRLRDARGAGRAATFARRLRVGFPGRN